MVAEPYLEKTSKERAILRANGDACPIPACVPYSTYLQRLVGTWPKIDDEILFLLPSSRLSHLADHGTNEPDNPVLLGQIGAYSAFQAVPPRLSSPDSGLLAHHPFCAG